MPSPGEDLDTGEKTGFTNTYQDLVAAPTNGDNIQSPTPAIDTDHREQALRQQREIISQIPSSTEAKASLEQPIINALDTPIKAVMGPGSEAASLPEGTVDRLQAELIRQRDEILALPSREDGLNMDRVQKYRQSVNAPNKAIRALDSADYVQAMAVANETADDPHGLYLSLHDVVIVERDQALEKANGGPEITESFLVHELVGHGSNEHTTVHVHSHEKKRVFGKNKIDITANAARSGSIKFEGEGQSIGRFIEEGFAEYRRGQYVVNELGRPDGFAPELNIDQSLKKYFYHGKDGSPQVPGGALGAVVIEELIKRDPKVLTAFEASRGSEEGLQELAQKIEEIAPGLYRKMEEADVEDLDLMLNAREQIKASSET